MGWVEGVEVGEEVAEWPAWVLERCGGINEADDDLLKGRLGVWVNGGTGLTDLASLLGKSVSAWSIACTSAASSVSLTMKYGFVSVWSALKIDASYGSN